MINILSIFEFSSQSDKFGKLIAIIIAGGTLSIGSNLGECACTITA